MTYSFSTTNYHRHELHPSFSLLYSHYCGATDVFQMIDLLIDVIRHHMLPFYLILTINILTWIFTSLNLHMKLCDAKANKRRIFPHRENVQMAEPQQIKQFNTNRFKLFGPAWILNTRIDIREPSNGFILIFPSLTRSQL